MHVAICSFIPHKVAPQQSSAMLQTAGTNITLSIDLNKEKDKILSLQFDLLRQSIIKSACNLTYTSYYQFFGRNGGLCFLQYKTFYQYGV